MRRIGTSIAVVLSILLFVSICPAQPTATTAVPNLIRYGGTLKDATGAPIASATGVTFAIYKQQDGGAAVWMETQNVTTDAKRNTALYSAAPQPQDYPVTSFRKKSNAGWVCRCRDRRSSRVCCWSACLMR